MASYDCSDLTGKFPWPPANVIAMSAFHSSDADIRWDDPTDLDTGPTTPTVDTSTFAYATVVICDTPTLEASASGSFIVVNGPITAGDTLEVDGVVLTATAGAPASPDEFDGSSGNSSTIATNITNAINNGSVSAWGIASATASTSSVTLTADAAGADGNAITLSSTSSLIVASATTLLGGAAQSTLTIYGFDLTAAASRTVGGNDFDVADAGASLAQAIADPSNNFSSVTATWTGTCLNIYAAQKGEQGNGISVETNTEAFNLGSSATQGGVGTPCPPGQDNSRWNILGVNIYRSDTGERGPYARVNRVPVQALFYRDKTNVVEVPNEIIPWNGGWIFQGDSPNNKGWRLKTRYRNVVKRPDTEALGIGGDAVDANSPFDVEVYIDGERAVVTGVFGPKGEIDLSTEQVWDPVKESFEDPPIPTATSTVYVRYYYRKGNKLENTLDRRWKVFYRVTTVAVDTTGTSPTGLTETPLGYSPPVCPMESEKLDYMWKEAIRRNRWILEQGGERVKLYIRRAVGIRCDCVWDPRLREFSKQPLNACLGCYGTGWKGGYEGPYDLIVGPDDSARSVVQTPNGRNLQNSYDVWIGPSPMTSQRDFIVKQNGERFSIGPVTRTQVRGVTLQQSFTIGYLSTGDIRYQVPLHRSQLERLPWPETRYTRPEDADCEEVDPYPIGCDDQATPMATEVRRIPDGREQRGRTPVWSNLTYGGGAKKP